MKTPAQCTPVFSHAGHVVGLLIHAPQFRALCVDDEHIVERWAARLVKQREVVPMMPGSLGRGER